MIPYSVTGSDLNNDRSNDAQYFPLARIKKRRKKNFISGRRSGHLRAPAFIFLYVAQLHHASAQ